MSEMPKFLQGVRNYQGQGLEKPASLDPKLAYAVPADKRVRPLYIRAGNSSSEMVYLVLMCNDKPYRYCPIGAKGVVDVPFHVIEEVMGGSTVEIRLAAPQGTQGSVIVDAGLAES